MQLTDVFGGAALFDGPPIVGDGSFSDGSYDYAALGYDALPPFSGASDISSDAMPFEVGAKSTGGVDFTGRVSAGMLALMIVGVTAFYFWTRSYQH